MRRPLEIFPIILILLLISFGSCREDSLKILKFGTESPTKFYQSIYLADSGSIKEPSHLEFFLSPVFKIKIPKTNATVGFVYNGWYGFYLGSSNSAPLFSRRQNPYVYIEFFPKFDRFNGAKGSPGLSIKQTLYAHESNGMYLNNYSDFQKNERHFDSLGVKIDSKSLVSMGWNYWSTQARFFMKKGKFEFSFNPEIRIFVPQEFEKIFKVSAELEDSVFYDPVHRNVSIRDYDGLRMELKSEYFVRSYLVGKVILGARRGLATDSSKMSLFGEMGIRFDDWGVFLGYHQGYGKDLATYPYWYKRINMGIEAIY